MMMMVSSIVQCLQTSEVAMLVSTDTELADDEECCYVVEPSSKCTCIQINMIDPLRLRWRT